MEICQLCALDLPLFEVSIKAFHEIICVKNGPTLPHSTEDISGTDRATDTIFFALKSEEYFPADKIAINCSSIVLLTPPDLPTHAFFFHFFDKVKNKNFIITIMRFGRAIIDFNRAAVWAEAWDNARGILLHLML